MPLAQDLTKFTTASPVIASYDAVDFADGTGIVSFKGYNEKDSSGTNYLLTKKSNFSYDIVSTEIDLLEGFTKLLNLDFDLGPFNMPKTLLGKANFTVPLRLQSADAGAGSISSSYIIAKIRRWDGSTETDLFSVQSNTITRQFVSVQKVDYQLMTFSKELTRELIASGETLRVTIEVWGSKNNSESDATVQIAHDPADREGATHFKSTEIDSRVLEINIPFAIE